MIEEQATVVAIDGTNITLQSTVKSTCGSCQQVDSCGSGQVAKALPQRQISTIVTSHLPVHVGDSVLLAISEQALLTTAWQVYCWPLIGLLVFSGIGQWLSDHYQVIELWSVLLGLFGGYLGFSCARFWQKKPKVQRAIEPVIVKVFPANIPVIEIT